MKTERGFLKINNNTGVARFIPSSDGNLVAEKQCENTYLITGIEPTVNVRVRENISKIVDGFINEEKLNARLKVVEEIRETLVEYHQYVRKNTDLKVLTNCFDTDADGNCPMCMNDKSLCPKRFVDAWLEKKTLESIADGYSKMFKA